MITQSTKVAVLLFMAAFLPSCSTPSYFPPKVTADLTPNPDFGIMLAEPDAFKGSAVQLAGRVVEVQQTDRGTLIIVHQLPVQTHPAYGPVETGQHTGRFAVFYSGRLDPSALRYGDKLIVAADMQGAKPVNFDGVVAPSPYLIARCMHVWKTGPYAQISDYPWIAAGYWPLEEETYCTG